jgi:outer membrane lipoprotein carrier protein
MISRIPLLALISLLLPAPAHAGGREQLAAFTRDLKGLDARFEQRVYDPNGRQTETTTGTVKLSAPRLFRWEVRSPAQQLIVADGDHIWIYDPDLEQVTVRKQSLEEQGSPLTVLVDPSELERQFRARDGGRSGGLEWLVLSPRQTENAPFKEARLGFGPKGLLRMEFSDALGQRTVIGFLQWSRNPRFPDNTFKFSPPKGVDVLGDVEQGAEVTPLRD